MMNLSRNALEQALIPVLTAQGLPNPTYAVVIPMVFGGGQPELLIEVRAAGISQGGDPCFPGGRIDPLETPAQAAVRELEEELGIPVDPERILGQLPTVETYLGSKTNVYVCVISPDEASSAEPNRAEVAELMRIPLTYFLQRPNQGSYTVDGNTIWGMTAGAIHHLLRAWRRAGLG